MIRFVLALVCALPLAAQTANLLPMDDFIRDWKISRQFTIAVAEKMPAESYDFKATKEEMAFGEQMMHIAGSLLIRFRQISGKEVPLKQPPKTITKATALEWLNASFDYVIDVLPKLTAEQLDQASFNVDWPGRPAVNGRDMIMNMFVHVAHHRAQCEVYLRLKGITPPTYTF
jgi:uncharacterized damage-inducible protein DinB